MQELLGESQGRELVVLHPMLLRAMTIARSISLLENAMGADWLKSTVVVYPEVLQPRWMVCPCMLLCPIFFMVFLCTPASSNGTTGFPSPLPPTDCLGIGVTTSCAQARKMWISAFQPQFCLISYFLCAAAAGSAVLNLRRSGAGGGHLAERER